MRVDRRALSQAVVLGLCFVVAGCGFEETLEEFAGESGRQSATIPIRDGGDALTVGSFNIQVFGTKKADNPEVMDILASVVRQFDVIAIQEIRAKDQNLIPEFVELVNAEGLHYDAVVGPRLGRTNSKEQYAFIFDAARIEVVADSIATAPDPGDRLHREPLVTTFRVRGPPIEQAFQFTLVNIHTDPDETKTELDALADVFEAVRVQHAFDDDVILLGDLNVDYKHLGRLGQRPGILATIVEETTNTRGTKSYDNIVFDRHATSEFSGQAGVLSLQSQFSLSTEKALKVSDHLPIWAVFSIYEERQVVAGEVGEEVRR